MKHEMRIIYDDETKLIHISPETILVDRATCYAMLGLANEIVTRNGLGAPGFKDVNPQPEAKYGVQPCKTYITPPEE